MTLSESDRVPPVGSYASQRAVDTSDDTITVSGRPVGPNALAVKLAVALAAGVAGVHGSLVASNSGGVFSGPVVARPAA